jgi:hypothetical protein
VKRAGALILFALLPLPVWAGEGAELMEKEEAAVALSAEAVALSVRRVSLDEASLVLEYQLTNRSEGDVYAFSALYRTDKAGVPTVDGNLAYSFVRAGGTVEFLKALLEVPRWTTVEAPEIPFLVRLGKGQTQKETVKIPLPLRCHDPYDEHYPDGYPPPRLTAAGWKLSVGVLADDPQQPAVKQVKVSGRTDLYAIGYEDGRRRQVVVSSDVVADRLAVLEPARTREKALIKQSKP